MGSGQWEPQCNPSNVPAIPLLNEFVIVNVSSHFDVTIV